MARINRKKKNGEQKTEEKSVVRVAGYVRCSDDGQAESDFNTLDNQKNYIAQHVQYVSQSQGRPWEISRFYVDSGYSGKNTDRPELEALLMDVCAGKVDVVVVYKLDRITRSLADFFNLDRMFNEHGVALVSVKEQFDTSHPMGRAMRNLLLVFAELERETIAERTRDKMYAEARQGRWLGGQIPYGYQLLEAMLKPDPVEARFVRSMFEKFAETKSLSVTRDYINGMGGRTRVRQQKGQTNGGKEWTIQGIDALLHNPRYTGAYTYGDIEIENNHEAIISRELFDLVNNVPAVRARNGEAAVDHPYVLQGLVFCPHCGGRMTPYHVKHGKGRKRSKPYTAYYECMLKHKTPTAGKCPVGRYNAEKLERSLLHDLGMLASDTEALEAVLAGVDAVEEDAAKVARLKEVREAVKQMEPQIARLVDAVSSGTPLTSIKGRLAELEAQQQALNAERLMLEADLRRERRDGPGVEDVRTMLGQVVDLMSRLKPNQRKEVMQCVVRKVQAVDKKTVEVTLNALPPLPDGVECSSLSMYWLPGVDSNHEPSG